jgi:deoxyribose-phosphate aldolase
MRAVSDIAKMIDHTLLRPEATPGDIERLCSEAIQYGFHSVCIQPFWVPLAAASLAGAEVKVATVIGFPLGATFSRVKVFEAMEAMVHGCQELDVVMNLGLAKAGRWGDVEKDLSNIISTTGGAVHKVIIETCYLDRAQKIRASELVRDVGAQFIKTSTGFGTGGATAEDIELIRSVVGGSCGIKASGGVKTLAQVREFISAGATRIGTSSGVVLMEEGMKNA